MTTRTRYRANGDLVTGDIVRNVHSMLCRSAYPSIHLVAGRVEPVDVNTVHI